MSRRDNVESKVYIGDLPRDAEEKELERAFSYYGTLRSVWVARNPPGFGFVEFEDPKDAEDAVRGLDQTTICGGRVRVEHATGKVRPKPWMRGGGGGRGGGGYGEDRGYRGGGGGRPLPYDDRCYTCGERGHMSRDCTGGRRSGGGRDDSRRRGGRSRSRSRDRRRSYSRSRSGSRSRR